MAVCQTAVLQLKKKRFCKDCTSLEKDSQDKNLQNTKPSFEYMSHPMGKPTICIGENKGADQLHGVTAKLISAFVFASRIVQFLLYLTPGIQASSLLLCLYSSVCVGPVGKTHCWFSHETAHLNTYLSIKTSCMSHDVSQYHCYKNMMLF